MIVRPSRTRDLMRQRADYLDFEVGNAWRAVKDAHQAIAGLMARAEQLETERNAIREELHRSQELTA